MLDSIMEAIRTIGPLFAAVWILTVASVLWRPQKYFNSILLMLALAVSLVFVAGLLGEHAPDFLIISFCLIMMSIFLGPLLLILNGIILIRRERFSVSHLLSIGLGVFVGIGETACLIYVLSLAGRTELGHLEHWVLLLVFTVFYFSCLVLSFVIYSVFLTAMPRRMNFDYVIIHGCALKDGNRLTKLLQDRVDRAIEVYQKCRNKPYVIPSGGQGADEKISEAAAMKDYLLAQGVPADHILTEEQSATTLENLLNSKKIIDGRPGEKKTALVSSNYHVYRCLRYASDIGMKCTGIGAHTALYYWPTALIREFIAVFVTKRFLFWSLLGYLLFTGPLIYALFLQK
ncbi:MAG: YdcF family protein [Erysipelotrichaceae bacterium]|nr:YdcF family protein [Erysipelotrichaceae bacterium]MBO4538305.1 YdcF family protein [Erysipelotrichaceae bacterium]